MDIKMWNPMERELMKFLEEGNLTEAKMAKVIERLTSKGKKYVSYGKLKQEMGMDDESFDAMMKKAKQSNRHSNKYIFTEVEDEPAIGITAAKRKARKQSSDDDTLPGADPGFGVAHTGQKKGFVGNYFTETTTSSKINEQDRAIKHRENELWGVLNRHGWKGLDRLDLLPEGWQGMTETQIVESIIAEEFSLNEAKEMPFNKSNLEKLVQQGKGFKVVSTGGGMSDTIEDEWDAKLVKEYLDKGKTYMIVSNALIAAKGTELKKGRKLILVLK